MMLPLVWKMLVSRRWQAVVVVLLATFAAAAATAAPAYVAAAERSVVRSALGAATPGEMVVSVDESPNQAVRRTRELTGNLDWAPAMAGFTPVLAAETDVAVATPTSTGYPRVAYRVGICAHLTMVSGRCPMAAGEVILGEATARLLGKRAGDPLVTSPAYRTLTGWMIGTPPVVTTVVGVYRVTDPRQPYWGTRGYVVVSDPDRMITETIFTEPGTLPVVNPDPARRSVDQVLDPAVVTAAATGRLRAQVTAATKSGSAPVIAMPNRRRDGEPIIGSEADSNATSAVPDLLARIDREVALLHEVVPVAAVPLVVLCWFVIFLAAGYGTAARREELGLLALRGVRAPHRWWLACAESVLPVLAGAPLGYLVGVLGVRAVAPWLIPERVPVPLDLAPLPWAAAAVAGALLAGLLALRGQFATTTVDLLRQVPSRAGNWRSTTAEAVVVVLAGAATVQLYFGGGALVGVAQLVPALLVLAIGLLVARLVRPLARRAGQRSGRRGRIGPLLAARYLGRRGSATRLIPLLVVAIALLGFGVAALDVAARARTAAAGVELGAARVLQVAPTTTSKLLAAVAQADPEGRYAMAAVPVAGRPPVEPAKIAVDTTRLAKVATWPASLGISAAEAAARLRPTAPGRITLRGQDLAVDVTVEAVTLDEPATLAAVVVDASGVPVRLALGSVSQGGRFTYTAAMPCADGCRLAELSVAAAPGEQFTLTITEIRQGQPDGTSGRVDAAAGPEHWRLRSTGTGAEAAKLQATGTGVAVAVSTSDAGNEIALVPDSPYPLPVLAAGSLPDSNTLGGLDGNLEAVRSAGKVRAVPRSGAAGVLIDLEYAGLAAEPTSNVAGEVWMSAGAPADIVDRLTRGGLDVIGDRRLSELQARYDAQSPAVAARFNLLSVVLAMLLAVGAMLLVAVVDRRRHAEELRALRVQGVSRRAIASAAVRMYLWVVVIGLLGGVAAGAAAWVVAGRGLPVLDGAVLVPVPSWPTGQALLPPLVGGVLGLAVALVAAAGGLYRAAGRGGLYRGTGRVSGNDSVGRIR